MVRHNSDSYSWDGVLYTSSGAYTNTYTNVVGCDSIHTLNLTINYSNKHHQLCELYLGWSHIHKVEVIQIYTNVVGCDSVHILNLPINYSNTGS